MLSPLPEVPVWKRAQRAAAAARDFAALFEAARTAPAGAGRLAQIERAAALADALAAEAAAMAAWLREVAAASPHPPPPKAPPRPHWSEGDEP